MKSFLCKKFCDFLYCGWDEPAAEQGSGQAEDALLGDRENKQLSIQESDKVKAVGSLTKKSGGGKRWLGSELA